MSIKGWVIKKNDLYLDGFDTWVVDKKHAKIFEIRSLAESVANSVHGKIETLYD